MKSFEERLADVLARAARVSGEVDELIGIARLLHSDDGTVGKKIDEAVDAAVNATGSARVISAELTSQMASARAELPRLSPLPGWFRRWLKRFRLGA